MINGEKILALIPARGGSKAIPQKNAQRIGGRALVEWALDLARNTPMIDRIIVSSDSQEIIEKVNKHGLFAPFVRPAELARDNSPSLPVFQHGLKWIEDEDRCQYKYVVILEPTCPFRLPEHIVKGVEIALRSNATSVMSLVEISDHHPVRIKKLLPDGKILPFCIPEPEGLRRQDQEPAYIRNCAVLVFHRETLLNNRLWGDSPYGFTMDKVYYGINIDEPPDLLAASDLFQKMKQQGDLHLIDAKALREFNEVKSGNLN